MTKICNKCNVEKAVVEFSKDKSTKDGYTFACKDCRNSIRRKTKPTVYLKKCPHCGLEANTIADLENFRKHLHSSYGRSSVCKVCSNTMGRKLDNFNRSRVWSEEHKNSDGSYRTCTSCGIKAMTLEDLILFKSNKAKKFGKDSICKECYNAKERVDNLSTERKKTYKDRLIKSKLSKYGLTEREYAVMVSKAKGKCEICSKSFDENTRSCIDHCHTTGKVRGLLCDECNTSIGKLGDTSSSVYKAYKYLHSFEVNNVGAGF